MKGNELSREELEKKIVELEEQLASKSDNRYKSLFNNSPIPLWEEDFSGLHQHTEYLKSKGITNFEEYFEAHPEEMIACQNKIIITDVNRAALKLHEAKTKEELLGNLNKIFTEKSVEALKKVAISIANGDTEVELQAEVKTLTGTIKQIHLKLKIDFTTDDKAIAIISTFDITDKILADKQVIETRERFKKLFDNAQVGLFRADMNTGQIVDANQRAANIAGYDTIELLKNEYIPRERYVNPELRETILSTLQEKDKIMNFPVQMYDKNYHKYWVALSAFIDRENNVLEGAVSDITEIKRVEEELKESESKFRGLVETTSDWIWEISETGECIYVSPQAEAILGYKPEEFLGKSPFDFMKPDEASRVKEYFFNQVKEVKPINQFVNTNIHKNGREVIIETNARPIIDIYGNVKGYRGINRDITERIDMHRKLDQERRLSKQYLDVAAVMLVALNKNQEVTLINPKGCEILGYSNEEVIGKNWMENYIPAKDVQSTKEVFNQIISGNLEAVKYYENSIIRKDGTERMIAWHNSIFKDEHGNIIGLFSSGTDITEKKEAEFLISSEKARAENIIEGTNTGTWEWNIESGEVILNERYAAMLGYKIEEIIPLNYDRWKELIHPDDLKKTEQIVFSHFKKQLEYYDAEFRMISKNGQWKWINARGKVVQWGTNGKPLKMSGVHIDINQRKIVEKELLLAKQKAEESDRLKSAFMANMSHEIRTPMNGILGFTDLLKEIQISDTQRLKYVDVIQKSGHRMLKIINDLINISKIEAGQMEVEKSRFSINEQITDLYNFFKPEAEKKGLKLFVSKELPDHLSSIESDKEKFSAVLINLLNNAIKYTKEGNIDFGYEIKNHSMQFYVRDSGIGIAEKFHDTIFDRFVQADMSITKPYEGAGLGLSITKAYVEMLQGKIWFESEIDIGTTFFFTLPLTDPNQINTRYINKKDIIDSNFLSDKTILIAEDDEVTSIYLSEILTPRCESITICNNGNEVVETCKSVKNIDLVLMDVKMPELNGYEATKEIRKFNKDIIIIAQTAYAQNDEKYKAFNAGCNGYISKPIKINELLKLLKTHLDNNF